MKHKTLDLCDKRDAFSPSDDHPLAHRTSNMVDRLMRFLDRAFFNAQYFHGLPEAAESRVRALSLLWNFCPSSPETVKKHGGQSCPAEEGSAACRHCRGESAGASKPRRMAPQNTRNRRNERTATAGSGRLERWRQADS